MRYVLEGTWTGYTSAQSRVVHREVVDERRAERLRNVRSIRYTDGTCLLLDLRPALPREKVESKLSYSSLIRDAEAEGAAEFIIRAKSA